MCGFDWDPAKNRENLRKHGIRFETAELVFEDPWILSRKDLSHGDAEERYNALGEIAPGTILFVVFTVRVDEQEETIRLISQEPHLPRKRGCMKKLVSARKRDIAT